MPFSNLRFCSILIFMIVLCGSVQSRRSRKSELRPSDRNSIRSDEQSRFARGFSDMELMTAQGFGKRSKNMQIINRSHKLMTAETFGKRFGNTQIMNRSQDPRAVPTLGQYPKTPKTRSETRSHKLMTAETFGKRFGNTQIMNRSQDPRAVPTLGEYSKTPKTRSETRSHELMSAHGYGKRSKTEEIMNRLLMEWIAMGNNARNLGTSTEWSRNQDLDYSY